MTPTDSAIEEFEQLDLIDWLARQHVESADCTGLVQMQRVPNTTAAPVVKQNSVSASSRITVVAVLNDRWRVRDDGLQWILERRQRRSNRRGTGWEGRSYCTQRRTLLGCVHDHCGDLDADALSAINRLPDRYRRAKQHEQE